MLKLGQKAKKMSTAKDVKPPVPPPAAAPPEYKMRSERRAARVAQEKIAESAKYLASNKIMATTSPPPPVKRRNRKGAGKKVAATAAAPATTVAISTPSKIAFVTVPPQIRMSTAGFKTAPIVRTNAATSLPIAIRPQMLAGQTLPKMPILVFNSLGSNMPTLIPISASSLAPNTIVTLAPGGGSSSVSGIRRAFTTTTTTTTSAIKTMQPVTLKSPVVTCKQAAPSNVISNKFLRYNNTTRHTISLTMECEEETLSSAQWLKYRKAESEYIDVLRKLTRWKGRSDVEIVNLGPDDPIPPLPRFLNVQEASRLVISDKLESTDCNVFDDDVIIEMETMSADQSSALTPVIQFEDPKEKSVTNPRVNVVMIPPSQTQSKVLTSSASETASTSSVAPVRRPPSKKLLQLYGKPRRTTNKNLAANLYSRGLSLDEVAELLHVTRITAEVYLIDSLFLDERIDHERLSRELRIRGRMMERVAQVLRGQGHHWTGGGSGALSLPKLQALTRFTFNQLRLCIARIYRGLHWTRAEEQDLQQRDQSDQNGRSGVGGVRTSTAPS